MAEIVVSAVVTVLIEKLISGDLMKLARSEGIDSHLNKWKKTLPMIEAVLADAGQKHITQRAVKLWLQELQHLAYDIDDVLDDLATEIMRRKLNDEQHANTGTSKVLLKKIIPTCCTDFTPHTMMYGRKMGSMLDEITEKLNDLVELKNNLGLDVNVKVEIRSNRSTNSRSNQTSLVDVSKVLGREADKDALLEKLLGEDEARNENVSVVSIVGLGGIGKTTLAKVLYNDDKVKDHFELRAWVCVSDEFDVFNISQAIYQAVGGELKTFATMDLLHVALKEKLSKKRFLIVLDDVWNEDGSEWELLQNPFIVGASGSKVMVTTRKTKVASVMNSFQPHNLEVLSDEIALSLFAQYALDEPNFDKHSILKSIAQGIIKKCDGLPLALVTLGRVLKTKGTSDDEWEDLLNSEIWHLDDGSAILPALKLSYYDLPLHLKQLFAYCSLFPKDYLFNKNELVLLWMAEGFLVSQEKGNKSIESLGRRYFQELTSRSFFQQSTDDESKYTMHDLMNDLAVSVAGEFFFFLDDNMDVDGRNEAFEKFRHFSFTFSKMDYGNFKGIHRPRCLRTFLRVSGGREVFNTLDYVLVELLPQLQFLRVLSLTRYSITQVPQSIGSLKHLRYLNFSFTKIKILPEQVSNLYNLQSLLVRDCDQLSRLPDSFEKLVNLRHLDMSGTPQLNKTPLGIGGLTNLQTLSKIMIEGGNGVKLSELKDLLELQGRLSIKGLDKVIDPGQAKDANLQGKKDLDNLDMEWSQVFDDSRKSTTEYEVLEWLKPHDKLKTLRILWYGGMKFPSWVGESSSFNQLTELILQGCNRCTHLPTLGHLSSLRKLILKSMNGVQIVGYELLAPTNSCYGIVFRSLEYLEIFDMEVLEMWSTSTGHTDETATSFPRLLKIRIIQCPRLFEVSIGLTPSLEDLYIEECSEAVLRGTVSGSSSILRLEMVDIKGLTQLHAEVLEHLRAVEYLSINNCDELRYLWESNPEACWVPVIREVSLYSCKTLEFYDCPDSVKSLKINSCNSMEILTISETSSLKILEIYRCRNLIWFPHEHLQSFMSLELLLITNCQNIDFSFPCGLWPPNLRSLTVGDLNNPMSEWGLQNYPISLVELCLYGEYSGVVSFAMEEHHMNTSSSSTTFLLPPSLTSLTLRDFNEVESISEVVLQHLTRLESLTIFSCPNLIDVPPTTSSLRVMVFP